MATRTGSSRDVSSRRSAAESARVRALESLGVVYTQPEVRFDRLTRLARHMFGVTGAAVTLIDHDRVYIKSSDGSGFDQMRLEDSLCQYAIAQSGTLVIEDTSTDPTCPAGRKIAETGGPRFYAGHPLVTPGGHRIGAFCLANDRPRVLTEDERVLLAELAGWAQQELTRSAELEHAGQVQRSLMPREQPSVPGYDISGVCLPCRGVGGDFVDWYRVPDGSLIVTLGDVMGKGMPAAITMASVRTAMRAAGQTCAPAAAVESAEAALFDDLDATGTLVTLCHTALDPEANVLRVVDAGHGLMIWLGADGEMRRAAPESGGLPLGVLPGQRRQQYEVPLLPGEVAIVFSDGVLDLYDGTVAAMDTLARDTARAVAAGGIGQAIQEVVDRANASSLLSDDVTVVMIRRMPA